MCLWLQLQSIYVPGDMDTVNLSTSSVYIWQVYSKGSRVTVEREASVKALYKPTKDGTLYKAWHRDDIQ